MRLKKTRAERNMNTVNICYATNESFAPYMAVSITSLLENNASCNVVVHILHSDLSEATKARLSAFENRYKNAKIIFHKIDDLRFEKFWLTIEHITKETYFRYMIAEVLPNIDCVLYLDGDTIVNGDISELFDTDLTNYYCAGVSDIYIESVGYKKTLGIDGLYINAGVILFNLDEMRKTDIAEKLFKLTAENNFKYQDQDAINVVFNGKIKELDCIYNFKRAHQKAFPEKTPSAKIVHSVGPNKPWRKFTFNRLKRLYFRYKNIFMETKKTYEEIVFKATPPKDDIMRILDKAWHLRDFEIELYWKRTIYFSTFAGALFVGYCSEIFKDAPSMKIIISFLGVVISWIWLLVNKGSKYWQENWENHINLLEEELGNEIYKVTLSRSFSIFNPFKNFAFSVSQLNQFVVLSIWGAWMLLLLQALPIKMSSGCKIYVYLTSMLIIYILLAVVCGKIFASKQNYCEHGKINGSDVKFRKAE